jgi:hypothetical protein
VVTSEFPLSGEGARKQRLRWEKGHLQVILTRAPRLILKAIVDANWDLMALALDLAVPPLSLLAALLAGSFLVASVTALLGASAIPMWLSLLGLAAYSTSIVTAWLCYGRDLLPAHSTVRSIWPFLKHKLEVYYLFFFSHSNSGWIRTDRTKE